MDEVPICLQDISHMAILSPHSLTCAREVRALAGAGAAVSSWARTHGSFWLCFGDFHLGPEATKRVLDPAGCENRDSQTPRLCASQVLVTADPVVTPYVELKRLVGGTPELGVQLLPWDGMVTADDRVEVFAISPADPSIRLHIMYDPTGEELTRLPYYVEKDSFADRCLRAAKPLPLVIAIHCLCVAI